MKILAWVFLPTKEDRDSKWEAPEDYPNAHLGEIRMLPETHPSLQDERFEPGWKRVHALDQRI